MICPSVFRYSSRDDLSLIGLNEISDLVLSGIETSGTYKKFVIMVNIYFTFYSIVYNRHVFTDLQWNIVRHHDLVNQSKWPII